VAVLHGGVLCLGRVDNEVRVGTSSQQPVGDLDLFSLDSVVERCLSPTLGG